MEAIGQLAGGVAHDFNNMLMIIGGYAELICGVKNADPEIKEYATHLQEATLSATNITRQLVAFSRRQVMEYTVQNVNTIVSDLGKMLPRLIGEQITVTFALDPNLPLVRVDRGQTEQILINLAVNARDAMLGGGVLTIETGTRYFDDAYVHQHPHVKMGNYVMLSVRDTGTGMDPETRARVFEPFFTTKDVGKGTGLGLATVYGVVKQSEGFIWVDSEVGQGTTFKIYLPVVATELRRTAPKEPEAPIARGTETILLVEDEALLRSLTQEFLTDCGYKIIATCNGEEALSACPTPGLAPDLVLTDMVMPGGMSSMEMVKAIRQRFPNIKSIYMSGYADRVSLEQLGPGAVFLQKPITLRQLSFKIRQMLDAPAKPS
jgi:CheY-like chemotaxis protein